MKLRQFRESITERAIMATFTDLVNGVNSVDELLDASTEKNQEYYSRLGVALRALETAQNRIARLEIDGDMWGSIGDQVSSSTEHKTWKEFQSLLTRRLIPSLVLSLKKIVSEKLPNDHIQTIAAKERLQSLQNVVVGLAPQTGIDQDDFGNNEV